MCTQVDLILTIIYRVTRPAWCADAYAITRAQICWVNISFKIQYTIRFLADLQFYFICRHTRNADITNVEHIYYIFNQSIVILTLCQTMLKSPSALPVSAVVSHLQIPDITLLFYHPMLDVVKKLHFKNVCLLYKLTNIYTNTQNCRI